MLLSQSANSENIKEPHLLRKRGQGGDLIGGHDRCRNALSPVCITYHGGWEGKRKEKRNEKEIRRLPLHHVAVVEEQVDIAE